MLLPIYRTTEKQRESTTVNLGLSGFDLADKFIRIMRRSGLSEDHYFKLDVIQGSKMLMKITLFEYIKDRRVQFFEINKFIDTVYMYNTNLH